MGVELDEPYMMYRDWRGVVLVFHFHFVLSSGYDVLYATKKCCVASLTPGVMEGRSDDRDVRLSFAVDELIQKRARRIESHNLNILIVRLRQTVRLSTSSRTYSRRFVFYFI